MTRIINESIASGIVPKIWKDAVVTPILKKGDPKEKENYRPVSCLPVASKVLEKIVCDQITRCFEVNKLLPDNQHGFRAGRSTMTALASMQQDWVQNWDGKMVTGILLWDLSAAYDTLCPRLFCKKLKVYGLNQLSYDWFKSFLMGRTQCVKIGRMMLKQKELV